MAQSVGIVEITWRGVNIPVEKGAKLKLGGIKNNPVIAGRGVSRAQEWVASEITATTPLFRQQRYSSLWDEGEGELIVQCDTRQSYTFPDAFLTDPPEITGGEGGKLELKWVGGQWSEVIG